MSTSKKKRVNAARDRARLERHLSRTSCCVCLDLPLYRRRRGEEGGVGCDISLQGGQDGWELVPSVPLPCCRRYCHEYCLCVWLFTGPGTCANCRRGLVPFLLQGEGPVCHGSRAGGLPVGLRGEYLERGQLSRFARPMCPVDATNRYMDESPMEQTPALHAPPGWAQFRQQHFPHRNPPPQHDVHPG